MDYFNASCALQGPPLPEKSFSDNAFVNASSTLQLKDDELRVLREALERSGGSFEQLFKGIDQSQGTKIV